MTYQQIRTTKSELLKEIVFESGEFEAVVNLTLRAAPTKATVLLLGESGTGKELLARLLHTASLRSDGPFTIVNCAALPESLLESELFGYEKGAFTGADRDKIGLFEESNQGTLFIDEIGDLPSAVQVKLLRFLQDHRIYRVGARQEKQLDVRVIAATHRNLTEMVRTGTFREDLYYRLNVVTIRIPLLRHRRRDIRPLVEHFHSEFAQRSNKPIRGLTPETWQCIQRYDWPGNVRELQNALEHAVVFTEDEWLKVSDLPAPLSSERIPEESNSITHHSVQTTTNFDSISRESNSPVTPESKEHNEPEMYEFTSAQLTPTMIAGNFFELVEQYERSLIEYALKSSSGNRSEAARKLGISEKNIRDREAKWKTRLQ